jgi:hypothetical protein
MAGTVREVGEDEKWTCARNADRRRREKHRFYSARLIDLWIARARSTRSRMSLEHSLGAPPQDCDVDIDAVEDRAADVAQVLLDLAGRAAAFARGVAVKTALAPVQITTAPEYER